MVILINKLNIIFINLCLTPYENIVGTFAKKIINFFFIFTSTLHF